MPQHVACMIDLETLGLSANCVIISIAAVKVDLRAPEFSIIDSFQRYIDITGQTNRVIEGGTVLFWMKQSKDQQQELLTTPRVGLHFAAKEFYTWYTQDSVKPKTVWSKGASFDISIMDHLYRGTSSPTPWHYRDGRDYRTIAECLPTELPRPRVLENLHSAREDAEAQIEHLWAIFRKWKLE
jgi:hypothetical protein